MMEDFTYVDLSDKRNLHAIESLAPGQKVRVRLKDGRGQAAEAPQGWASRSADGLLCKVEPIESPEPSYNWSYPMFLAALKAKSK